MIHKPQNKLTIHPNRKQNAKGFGMTEMLVSLAAGGLVIIGAGTALQSMQGVMSTSGSRATLRQNTINGLKLLRNEATKADHLLIYETGNRAGTDTDLQNYEGSGGAINVCKDSTAGSFKPIFGLRNSRQLPLLPIIYGIGLNTSGHRYALYRCGPAIREDGSYDVSNVYVATLLDDIGVMPQETCVNDQNELTECEEPVAITKELNGKTVNKSLEEILTDTINRTSFNHEIQDESSPPRRYREPAFRFSTDADRRLLTFIGPNPNYIDANETAIPSFLQLSTGLRSLSLQPLQFTAYARADKRIAKVIDGNIVLDGLFFRGELSQNVRFLLDGSGSMQTCIYQSPTPVYVVTRRGRRGRSGRAKATYPCIVNRMQALKGELITLLQDLHDSAPNTEVGLESFSIAGTNNHKGWLHNGQTMSRIGDDNVLESAFAFINSIDEYKGSYTDPWGGLKAALDDHDADTLFFLSDGKPTQNPSYIQGTTSNNFEGTAAGLSELNHQRPSPITIHTISLGRESGWMQELSQLASGDYNYVDVESVQESQMDNNS